MIGAGILSTGGRHGCRLLQESANGGDIALAVGVGEDPVVADAVKAGRENMQQEAAHELFGAQGHRFVARAPLLAVVLPPEADAPIIQRHETGVGDSHSMGVSG
jgi:hypothetical protein